MHRHWIGLIGAAAFGVVAMVAWDADAARQARREGGERAQLLGVEEHRCGIAVDRISSARSGRRSSLRK